MKQAFILIISILSITFYGQNANDYINSGDNKGELKDYKGAIEDYTKAIELNSKDGMGYSFRAWCKLQLGDKQGACLDWRKASELGYSDANYFLNQDCKEVNSKTIEANYSQTGTVKGELCYPSEGNPSLRVLLRNIEKGNEITLITKNGQNTFEFKNVPTGHYSAYAYNDELGNGGGYTPAVACGLTIACKDHKLIEFEVKTGETTEKIKICDWYGAILPSKTTIIKNYTAKDFFIPSSDKNITSFNYGKDDESIKEKICYINNGNTYDVETDMVFKNKVAAMDRVTIQFKETVIEVIKVKGFTALGEKYNKNYTPSKIIFKMPIDGQNVKWNYTEGGQGAEINKCTSEWMNVTVNGVAKKAVIITTKVYDAKGVAIAAPITLDYYVEGIGLWKQVVRDPKRKEKDATMLFFHGLSYDNIIK